MGSQREEANQAVTRLAVIDGCGIVAMRGPDVRALLQGIITNDMDLLGPGRAVHAGLLSPQGKILFAFFLIEQGGDVLLETGRSHIADLIKRLSMYKLRAKVAIEDVSSGYSVAAVWNGDVPQGTVLTYRDPRLARLGSRVLLPTATGEGQIAGWVATGQCVRTTEAEYHAHRIALGVPQEGLDFELGATFPHEALYDQLAGVSFTKGCYVGQEVVSRMQHRGTARKRIVPFKAESAVATGRPVSAGGAVVVGNTCSVAGLSGLAAVRLDRVLDAHAKGQPLTVDGVSVVLVRPGWASFEVAGADEAPDGM